MNESIWNKPISRKSIVSVITLALLGFGSCEYSLYKKFEKHPNIFQEMGRWPYNEEYSQYEKIEEKIKMLNLNMVEEKSGIIKNIHKIPFNKPSQINGFDYSRYDINFINLEDKKLVYSGISFAEKGDSVRLKFVPIDNIKRLVEYYKMVQKFNENSHIGRVQYINYENPQVRFALKNIPENVINNLDGIIENYKVIEKK